MANAFTIQLNNTSISSARTLLWVNPGTTRSLRVVEIGLAQNGSTTSQIQRVQVVRQVTAFPTLTSFTPVSLTNDATSVITGGTAGAAGTSGTNASAEGAGAKTVLWESSWNTVNGEWRWIAGPDNGILLPAGSSSGFGVYLPAMIATMTLSAYLHFVQME